MLALALALGAANRIFIDEKGAISLIVRLGEVNMRSRDLVRSCMAAGLVWLGAISLVQAANSCIEYRSLIGSQQLVEPYAATAQEASAAGVTQCNSWWHNAVGSYGGNVWGCNGQYACTGVVPVSVQTPTMTNSTWQQMTVLVSGSGYSGSGVVSLWLEAFSSDTINLARSSRGR